jgi:hypothetical protein
MNLLSVASFNSAVATGLVATGALGATGVTIGA